MATPADLKQRPGLIHPCKRGDVIAWASTHTYTYANATSRSETTYTIGIVTRMGRDRLAKTADTGMGTATVDHTIQSCTVRADMIDAEKARAWLGSDQNYPRAGSTPLRSLDAVRAVVRQWLRD